MALRDDVLALYASIGRTTDVSENEIQYWITAATAGQWSADQLTATFMAAASQYQADSHPVVVAAAKQAKAIRDATPQLKVLAPLPEDGPFAMLAGLSTIQKISLGLSAYFILRRIL